MAAVFDLIKRHAFERRAINTEATSRAFNISEMGLAAIECFRDKTGAQTIFHIAGYATQRISIGDPERVTPFDQLVLRLIGD